MNGDVEVSVVVCTLDRASSLERTVRSLLAQTHPHDRWEFLIVDNGSTDDTPAVAARAAAARGNVRYVTEPALGLSNARNRGIDEALGELVAFIDDDAEAEPSWVSALWESASDTGAAALGGRVELAFPAERPGWLPPRLEGHYSGLDLGPERMILAPPRTPYGTNMAIRADVLTAVGVFSPDLGRAGRNLISNEETELFHRIRRHGGAVVYEPSALVHHHVEPERLSRRYLLRRAYAQGRSRAMFEAHVGHRSRPAWWRQAAGSASAAIRQTPVRILRAGRTGTDRPAQLLEVICQTAARTGYAREAAGFGLRRPSARLTERAPSG